MNLNTTRTSSNTVDQWRLADNNVYLLAPVKATIGYSQRCWSSWTRNCVADVIATWSTEPHNKTVDRAM